MIVYVAFFILLIIGGISFKERDRYFFLFIITLFFFIILGFRSISVGPDTPSYVADFRLLGRMSWQELLLVEKKEPLYFYLTWLFSQISDSYLFFLCGWALFPAIAVYIILREESSTCIDITIAYIVIFVVGVFAFWTAGIRQAAAISIVLFSYRYLKHLDIHKIFRFYKDLNFIKFCLCIYIAFLLHKTVLVFLLIYPISRIKIQWWYVFIPFGLIYIGDFIKIDQISALSNLVYSESYEQYGTSYESELSLSGFYIQAIIFFICLVKKNALIKKDSSNTILFNLVLLGLFFQSMTGMLGEFFRVSLYFSVFSFLLVPRALAEYRNDIFKKLGYLSFISLSLVYLFFLASSNLPEYSMSIFNS